jgi:hypothetical protein
MGLAERADTDARDVAADLGIEIVELRDVPWLVGSTGNTVLCRWSASEAVTQTRIWQGISQCLLERLGIEWTNGQVRDLSQWLRAVSN